MHKEAKELRRGEVSGSLFALKVWREEVCEGHIEWRGLALDVESGQESPFEDWPELVDLIADALAGGQRTMDIER